MNSPFNQEQAELLNKLLPTLTESQKVWLGGYLAATQFETQSAVALETPEAPVSEVPVGNTKQVVSKEVTILYGSQTGNAQGVAEKARKTLEGLGFQVAISSMSDFKPNNLKKLQNLLIVASTHGEGEPPDNAIGFHEFLYGKRAPKLDDLNFSVLSLGDSSYEFFCQTGKDFDQRLEALGGKRIYSRVDCDLDYDEQVSQWIEGVLGGLNEAQGENSASQVHSTEASTVESTYSRTNPFKAEVLENLNLNGRGSNKETRHLELSLEGSGLNYQPGDSLGIIPENDPALVELLIEELKWNPDEIVQVKEGDKRTLKDALISYYEITTLTKPLLQKVAELSTNDDLQQLLAPGNEEKVKAYLEGRDLLDLVQDFGRWGESAQEFVSILRKIPARLYSI